MKITDSLYEKIKVVEENTLEYEDNEEDITDTESTDPYFRYGIAVSEKTIKSKNITF